MSEVVRAAAGREVEGVAREVDERVALRRHGAEPGKPVALLAVGDELGRELPGAGVADQSRGARVRTGADAAGHLTPHVLELLLQFSRVVLQGFEAGGQVFDFRPAALDLAEDGLEFLDLVLGWSGGGVHWFMIFLC